MKSSTNKEKFRDFCKTHDDLPIFLKDWWLDVTCNQNWDVVVNEEKNKITGFWVFNKIRKKGFNFIVMPVLTKFNGIYIINEEYGSQYQQLSDEHRVIEALLNKLPEYHSLNQNIFYSNSNWLPLFWRGFTQTTYYSYELKPLNPDIMADFKPRLRSTIRKAGRELKIKAYDDIRTLYKLAGLTYARKKNQLPYSLSLIEKLYQVAKNHDSAQIYVACKDSDVVAASLFVWDNHRYYYLIGGMDPQQKKYNGNALLLYHGIKKAHESGKIFDFEGSMNKSIEKYFRSFGASQIPYFKISHTKSRLLKIRNFLKEL